MVSSGLLTRQQRGERETGCECVFRLYTVEEWIITIYASLSPWNPPYRSPPPHTHRHPPTKTNTHRTETAEPGAFLGSPIFPFCSVSDGGASEQQIKQRVALEGPGEARGPEIQRWIEAKALQGLSRCPKTQPLELIGLLKLFSVSISLPN